MEKNCLGDPRSPMGGQGLTCDDPVLKLYKQQKKLIYKNNWANEVSWLRKHYEIKETDCEIKKYKMEKWKILQKNKGASVQQVMS